MEKERQALEEYTRHDAKMQELYGKISEEFFLHNERLRELNLPNMENIPMQKEENDEQNRRTR